MSLYNPEIHHRRSIRLRGYDYSRHGHYFITICLENIRCMFAGWKDGRLHLTKVGRIAKQYWREIPEHYSNVSIDEFVMMPDHIHGILHILDENSINNGDDKPTLLTQNTESNEDSHKKVLNVEAQNRKNIVGAQNFVPIQYKNTPLPNASISQQTHKKQNFKQTKTTRQHDFQKIIPKSIGSIIRAYKSAVTLWCKRNGFPQFKWQRNYYEHIIRSDDELKEIQWYIQNNPGELLRHFPGLNER